jgi:hypothetical protein
MAWKPKFETVVQLSAQELKRFVGGDPDSVLSAYQLQERKGINKSGEFPVAVVRRIYDALGYATWFSGQSKLGDETYLLTRMPKKRRDGDPAYKRIADVFGAARVGNLERAATEGRNRKGIRAAGGDPDLFVFHRREPALRFFVEVKLENLARVPPYRDCVGEQQELLFPLIEEHLGCGVRLARVQVVAAG